MARRRDNTTEVSLFPFLSILACLIGTLVLLIVVLVVSQTTKADGRTPEEIRMAQDFLKIQQEIEDRKKLEEVIKEKLAELEKIKQDIEEREQRYIRLRKLLDTSKETQEQNLAISQLMQKELDDLMVEIDGLKKQEAESKKEIEQLLAEIKKREIPKDAKPPPVVVQPGGSGLGEGTKVYFVEAAGGALRILNAWGEDYLMSAKNEVVVADPNYNYFLDTLTKDPNAMIVFLIRDDGQGAFNTGAGRAQNDYKLRVAKLPIPGKGPLDLKEFASFAGKIPPPPPPPPPDATPPAEPAKGAPKSK